MAPWPHVEQKPGVGVSLSVPTGKTSDCPQTWAGLYFVPSVLPRDQKPCILCMGESGREGRAGLSASRECEPNHLPHAHQLIAGEHTRGPREPQSHSAGKDFRSRKITLQSPRWEMKETEEGTHRREEFTEGECLQRRGISRGGASPEGACLQRGSICRGEYLQRRGISRGRASAEGRVSAEGEYLQRRGISRGGASAEREYLPRESICRGGASVEGEYLQRRGIYRGGVSAEEEYLQMRNICRGRVSAEERYLQKSRCRSSSSADMPPLQIFVLADTALPQYLQRRSICTGGASLQRRSIFRGGASTEG